MKGSEVASRQVVYCVVWWIVEPGAICEPSGYSLVDHTLSCEEDTPHTMYHQSHCVWMGRSRPGSTHINQIALLKNSKLN